MEGWVTVGSRTDIMGGRGGRTWFYYYPWSFALCIKLGTGEHNSRFLRASSFLGSGWTREEANKKGEQNTNGEGRDGVLRCCALQKTGCEEVVLHDAI